MKLYTLADFGKDAPVGGAVGAAAVTEPATLLGIIPLNDLILWAGAAYAVGRLAMLGVECYWKWKDRRDGKGQ